MVDGPFTVVRIRRVADRATDRRPAVENRRAIEAEVVGHLRGSIDGGVERHVEAVDEDEGFLASRTADERAQLVVEARIALLLPVNDDEMPGGILAPKRPDVRPFDPPH